MNFDQIQDIDVFHSNKAIVSKFGSIQYVPNWALENLKANDVAIRPLAVGVCGTDIKIFNHQKICANGPIGHEATALVTRIGQDVVNYSPGDIVVVSPHIIKKKQRIRITEILVIQKEKVFLSGNKFLTNNVY